MERRPVRLVEVARRVVARAAVAAVCLLGEGVERDAMSPLSEAAVVLLIADEEALKRVDVAGRPRKIPKADTVAEVAHGTSQGTLEDGVREEIAKEKEPRGRHDVVVDAKTSGLIIEFFHHIQQPPSASVGRGCQNHSQSTLKQGTDTNVQNYR